MADLLDAAGVTRGAAGRPGDVAARRAPAQLGVHDRRDGPRAVRRARRAGRRRPALRRRVDQIDPTSYCRGRTRCTSAHRRMTNAGCAACSSRSSSKFSTRRSADRRGQARPLDPPLLVVLDEAANIAPLAELDGLAATCAGHGVQLLTSGRTSPRSPPGTATGRPRSSTTIGPSSSFLERPIPARSTARAISSATRSCSFRRRRGTRPVVG